MPTFRVVAVRSAVMALCPIAFGACNSASVVGSVVRPGTWSLVSVPTTGRLAIVRGSSSADVWIEGDSGTWRWDGQHWTTMPGLYPSSSMVGFGVWVNAPNDAWVGGFNYAFHWTGTAWIWTKLNDNRYARTFWGSGPSDVWTSDCAAGYLGHYGGDTTWTHLTSAVNGVAIWGSGTHDVWMVNGYCDPWGNVSGGSLITHWAGVSAISGSSPFFQVAQDTQFTFPHALRAMWGSGTSDIWSVGDSGAIVHYNGSAWSPITHSPTSVTLRGVWGTAANDVWAVGESGVIVHFDGSGWAKGVSPTTRTLRSVWGSPSGAVWAVGDSATVLHFTR